MSSKTIGWELFSTYLVFVFVYIYTQYTLYHFHNSFNKIVSIHSTEGIRNMEKETKDIVL